ncbi:hypothetical protein ARTHRO9AX_80120 [Arthrobacter sp. 9AX]|nr:hypothetical protein ARTHRO9AX_80120 [Arthrobacter sp. 9AX]
MPIRNSGAKPYMAFFTVVTPPSGPGSGSNVNRALSETEPDGLSPPVNVTLARSSPSHSPYSPARSPKGPPACPRRMVSRAPTWASDAESSTTAPTFQPPAVRCVGNQLTNANSTPDRSVSSRFPLAIWKTFRPRHSPSGPVGMPSTGHGQISWHVQLPAYVPDISQDTEPSSPGVVAVQEWPGFWRLVPWKRGGWPR